MVWAMALPSATFVMSSSHAPLAIQFAALAVYLAGSIVCHQLPSRTFQLWSHPMPVCARCTGIYVGAALAVVALVSGRVGWSGGQFAPETARRTLAVAALPALATIVFEWMAGETPSNAVRALTGIPLGGVVALLIASAQDNASGAAAKFLA
jgi:uncharacterized membrane protein